MTDDHIDYVWSNAIGVIVAFAACGVESRALFLHGVLILGAPTNVSMLVSATMKKTLMRKSHLRW